MRATKEGIIRKDGRKPNQLRPIVCEHGHLHSADGSCRFSIGGTSVIASVIGPQQSNHYFDHSKIDRAHIDVNVQSTHGTSTKYEIWLQEQICSTFANIIFIKKYPQTTIHIHIQVISDDGSLLSCMLNSVSVALLDSGIDCQTFLTSISLGITSKLFNSKFIYDPTLKEESNILQCHCTIAYATSIVNANKLKKEFLKNQEIHRHSRRKGKSHIGNHIIAKASQDIEMKENNNDSDMSDRLSKSNMDLIYCDTKGKMNVQTLSKILEKSQVACYTMQFFIKKHFVEAFKALPTIYVASED